MFYKKIITSLTILAAAGLVTPGIAENGLVLKSSPQHTPKISITGTSTMHDWEVKGDAIDGTIRLANTENGDPMSALLNGSSAVTVNIPVRSLTSDNRRMDRIMLDSLEADRHDTITFTLTSIEASENLKEDGWTAKAHGKLTIAGSTREISFPVAFEPNGNKTRIQGKTDLKMTDFGIDPPRALLGTLRTGDDIEVSFSWTVAPAL